MLLSSEVPSYLISSLDHLVGALSSLRKVLSKKLVKTFVFPSSFAQTPGIDILDWLFMPAVTSQMLNMVFKYNDVIKSISNMV